MSKILHSDRAIAGDIDCLITDVDGVMTDGRIEYSSAGTELKRFHVHDGLGIRLWLRSGFRFAIITSRSSEMVARRAEELGIEDVVQDCPEKRQAAQDLMQRWGCDAKQLCYIGDDLPDLPVMKSGIGLSAAPSDATVDARAAADWVLRCRGGEGALRELIERLLRAKGRWEEHLPT